MKVFTAQGTRATTNRGAFTNATTGDYRVGGSGTTVPGRRVQPSTPTPRDDLSRAVIDWLESAESRPYEGRWVVLASDGQVVAQADRPAALPPEDMRRPGMTTLFVLPRNVRIGG